MHSFVRTLISGFLVSILAVPAVAAISSHDAAASACLLHSPDPHIRLACVPPTRVQAAIRAMAQSQGPMRHPVDPVSAVSKRTGLRLIEVDLEYGAVDTVPQPDVIYFLFGRKPSPADAATEKASWVLVGEGPGGVRSGSTNSFLLMRDSGRPDLGIYFRSHQNSPWSFAANLGYEGFLSVLSNGRGPVILQIGRDIVAKYRGA